ncbi:hypothetical protein PC128_g5335 [Phytophthora cactorum]|nr:hypothetical protein PC128_g5335 [Phytophthora cactorum]
MNIYKGFNATLGSDWTKVSSYSQRGSQENMVAMNNLNIDYTGSDPSPQGYATADGSGTVTRSMTFVLISAVVVKRFVDLPPCCRVVLEPNPSDSEDSEEEIPRTEGGGGTDGWDIVAQDNRVTVPDLDVRAFDSWDSLETYLKP